MQHRLLIITIMLCYALAPSAQTKAKWIKKVRAAQATAYAYNQQDSIIASANALFVGGGGQILTTYSLVQNATRIDVVDAKGKRWQVTTVDAANSLYNIARLNTTNTKAKGLTLAASEQPVGTAILIVPSLSRESILCKDATITIATPIESNYSYYTIQGTGSDETLNHVFAQGADGLPVMTLDGTLAGLLQLPLSNSAQTEQAYAVSAQFAMSLTTNGMSAIARDYAALRLPISLPIDEDQARTFVFLYPKTDSAKYAGVVEQYIARYPTTPFGYITKAEWYAARGDTTQVNNAYSQALSAIPTTHRDEILYSQSLYQYSRALAGDTVQLAPSYANALAAYNLNPLPTYRLHEAGILYSMRRFDQALDAYLSLTNTTLRSHSIFTNAAQCASMLEPDSTIMALRINLLDSALSCFARPYPAEAATAVWMRAQAKHEAGRYREAVLDYNEFEHLLAGQVSGEFYYIRSMCELSGRLYQQAIDDATRATSSSPNNTDYLVHAANVYLRLGDVQQARPLLQRAADLGEEAAREWLDTH